VRWVEVNGREREKRPVLEAKRVEGFEPRLDPETVGSANSNPPNASTTKARARGSAESRLISSSQTNPKNSATAGRPPQRDA
jgi:hypothetical protein